jgi:hypothetical protein
MSNRGFLLLIVATSLAAVIILGLFNLFILTPSFTDLTVENTELEAVKIARHLQGMIWTGAPNDSPTSPDFEQEVRKAVKDYGLMKIKIYAPDGRTLFSTTGADIGVVNANDYFKNRVASGKVLTKLIAKDGRSLENQPVKVDVVETYVPIIAAGQIAAGQFRGAFEIYLDITENLRKLNNLLFRLHVSVAILLTLLLGVVLFIARRADLSFLRQEKADAEKRELITELRKALEEVKTLRGIIPICSYCKQIRDDKGMWNKLELYIHEHSDAQFSHGICPKCFAEQMKKMNEEDLNAGLGSDPDI